MLSLLSGWRLYAVIGAGVLLLIVGFEVRHRLTLGKLDRCEARAVALQLKLETEARRKETAGAKAAAEVGAKVEQARVEIRTVTRTIIKEVPVVLTPEIDRRYPLPNGLVRLHDSAIRGEPPSPGPASEPDDGPSPVTASQAAGVLAGNAGVCHELRAQVDGWQEFYEKLRREWGK